MERLERQSRTPQAPKDELEPRLYHSADLEDPELHPIGIGLAAVFTARCPDSDGVNEDACALVPYDDKSGLLIVADGAGGMPGGERAAEIAVQTLKRTVKQALKKGEPLRLAALDGIEKAHASIQALGIGAATTLACAEVSGKKVRSYQAGDSQILVVGQKGKIKLLTKAHSPTGYAIEAGLLDQDEALMHEERHLVSNLLGLDGLNTEVSPWVELAANDTLIIASDGLFDNLTVDEITEICRKGQLLAIAHALAEECHARMRNAKDGRPSKPDDLTFICYRHRVST